MAFGEFELDVDVIVHEIAHAWFGNLVTPEWFVLLVMLLRNILRMLRLFLRWDDLWLAEGFTSFMEIQERKDDNLYDFIFTTLELDSLDSTYPISMQANTPMEMKQLFNEIVYYKVINFILSLIF
jgi:aminopeptidase N